MVPHPFSASVLFACLLGSARSLTRSLPEGAPEHVHAEARGGSSEGPSLVSALSNAGSDKTGHHGYDRVYTPLFEPLRAKPVRLVEIGVERGRSLKAWQEFFSAGSHVFGIGYGNWQTDFKTKCHAAKQTATNHGTVALDQCDLYRGDQSNITFLRTFLEDSGGRFDIIIDDGSHVPDHQRITFETLWPSVVPGGLFIIEDVETSYWGPKAKVYGYALEGQSSFVEHMQKVAHAINREFANGKSPLPDLYNDVSTITFAQNLIVVKKQTTLEGRRYFNRKYRFARNVPGRHD